MSPRSTTLVVVAIATLNVFMISAFIGARPASGAGPGVVITSPLAADGSVRISDPSVANQTPFGFIENQVIPGGLGVSLSVPLPYHVTAYSFYTDHDIVVTLREDNAVRFGVRVPAGQSITGSFHHAVLANRLDMNCVGPDQCTFLVSFSGY